MRKKRKTGVKRCVAAAFLMAVFLTGCTSERREQELVYRQAGIEAMQNADYQGAVAAFDAALSCVLGTIGEVELDRKSVV